jgi:hypothetical protein
MTISYHSGERIQATSTDFGTDGAGIPAISGGWKELGRTTLGSSADTIDVSSLPDKRYYMILRDLQDTGGTIDHYIRMGNSTIDTGSNYAVRVSQNGGADSTLTSQTNFYDFYARASYPKFSMGYLANLAGKEKLYTGHIVEQNTAGAGNVPARHEIVGKWSNTSNPMDIHRSWNQSGTGSYASGSEVVVLGWDDTDTHTTNFWEELASVEGDGSSATLDSGTITAKKYLWVQSFTEPSINSTSQWQVNSDTGANYTERISTDGSVDGTNVNNTVINIANTSPYPSFANIFIINNSANEKLFIGNWVGQNTAGAGNAPMRRENASKWVTTGSQITSIQNVLSGGVHGSNSIIKVWGSN